MAAKIATKMLGLAAGLGAGVVLFGSTAQSAHRPRGHHVAVAQAQPQIACTVLGCMPIPAACTPVGGKTPGGIPTGYDVIVCPPGVWPLK
jgi:hypothetical protein